LAAVAIVVTGFASPTVRNDSFWLVASTLLVNNRDVPKSAMIPKRQPKMAFLRRLVEFFLNIIRIFLPVLRGAIIIAHISFFVKVFNRENTAYAFLCRFQKNML
jgi:hypothetical protein